MLVLCGQEYIKTPYRIGRDGTRKEVIAKFKLYFAERVHDDIPFNVAVGELRDKRLGCCCKPDEECHGDVYVDFLNKVNWHELFGVG